MNKIKFKSFKHNNEEVTSIKIYLGNLNINESLDDVEAQMDIVDGDIKFTIIDPYLTKKEKVEIQSMLKDIDWDNGYEFFDFWDIDSKKEYYLIGDRNSTTFNLINSPKNLQNIQSIETKLK